MMLNTTDDLNLEVSISEVFQFSLFANIIADQVELIHINGNIIMIVESFNQPTLSSDIPIVHEMVEEL